MNLLPVRLYLYTSRPPHLGHLASVEFGLLCFRLGDAFGSFFGSFIDIARVAALGITGAGNKTTHFAEFDLQLVFAAFRAGFIKFLRGKFGAFDTLFFFHLLDKRLPEFIHHGNPLAFTVGNFVKLVFKFGSEVVIDVLGEVFGQEFVDDVACVGGL